MSLPPPAVVKPVDADNSTGVTLVTDSSDYPPPTTSALDHASAALVERYIPLGREVRCGVIESSDGLMCLPLEEYRVGDELKPVHGLDVREPFLALATTAKVPRQPLKR